MPTAMEAYEALKPSVHLSEDESPDEVFRQLKAFLSRVQHQLLSSQHDPLRRQLCGVFFAHAQHLFDLHQVYDTPKAWTARAEVADGRRGRRTAAAIAAGVCYFLCCLQLLFIREILLLIGLLLAGGLLAYVYATHPQGGKERIHLTQRVNLTRLWALVEATMRAIDRDMEAVALLLPGEDTRQTSSEALDLAAKILETERAGIERVPDAVLQAVDAFFIQQGIEAVDYTPENAPLFQTLPSKRAPRTLVPALLRDDRLLRKGMATTQAPQES